MTVAPYSSPPCLVCGYDLTGIDAPICPECATPRIVQPGSEFVAQPWPCVRCGYSLLGARHGGVCPECRLGVGRSLDPSLLRMQPVETLKTLQTGALLTTLGIVLPVFGPCFGSILLGFAMVQGRAAMMVIHIVGWLLLGLGVWRITTPLRGAHALRPPTPLSRAFRLTTVLAGACWIASSALSFAVYSGTTGPNPAVPSVTTAFAMQAAASLATFVCAVVGLLHIRSLMRLGVRRGKRGGAAATSALVVLLVAVGLTLAIVIFGSLTLLSNPGPQGVFGAVSGLAALGAGLAWFTAYISFIGVSDRLRLLIRRERRIGERARADAPVPHPPQAEVHA
ncbi:MAG: hypothetical protein KF684_09785 [Phycisphaeraceae bacterium]|nr:hypothetical protein [Phycisphaeraceae bacterium]